MLAYLGIPLLSGEKPEPASEIVRKAEADVSREYTSSMIGCADYPSQFVDAVTG